MVAAFAGLLRCRSDGHIFSGTHQGDNASEKYLRLALLLIGMVFLFGLYPLTVVWPSGWAWHSGQSHYLQMIVGLYATLGFFLALIAGKPMRHLSLIAFTIWSSVVHGGVMAWQAITDTQHFAHLFGDVPALFAVAAILAWLCPRAALLRLGPVAG